MTGSCRRCGSALPAGAAFCPACGERAADGPPLRSQLDRLRWNVRARAEGLLDSLAVRTRAQKRLARLQLELDDCWRRKSDLLTQLGHAVYTGDAAGNEEARVRLRALDAETDAKEREMESVRAEAARQLEEARARSAPTVAVTSPTPPSEPMPEPLIPPSPPTIPEPTPVPNDPPAPPQVPEPTPVPHEPPIPGEPDTPTRPS